MKTNKISNYKMQQNVSTRNKRPLKQKYRNCSILEWKHSYFTAHSANHNVIPLHFISQTNSLILLEDHLRKYILSTVSNFSLLVPFHCKMTKVLYARVNRHLQIMTWLPIALWGMLQPYYTRTMCLYVYLLRNKHFRVFHEMIFIASRTHSPFSHLG